MLARCDSQGTKLTNASTASTVTSFLGVYALHRQPRDAVIKDRGRTDHATCTPCNEHGCPTETMVRLEPQVMRLTLYVSQLQKAVVDNAKRTSIVLISPRYFYLNAFQCGICDSPHESSNAGFLLPLLWFTSRCWDGH